MKNVAAHARTWIAGTLIGLAGVALARLVAPHAGPSWQVACMLAGQSVALGGLALLCVGVNRRVRREPPGKTEPAP